MSRVQSPEQGAVMQLGHVAGCQVQMCQSALQAEEKQLARLLARLGLKRRACKSLSGMRTVSVYLVVSENRGP